LLATLLIASVGIRAGFSCSFPEVINHGRSTDDENRGFSCGIKALSHQMAVLTAKVDNNNNSANNNNNSNRGGGPIPIIRVCNNNHTTNTYRKLEHTRESDLEYSKLKDDYYKFKISDLIHCSLTF